MSYLIYVTSTTNCCICQKFPPQKPVLLETLEAKQLLNPGRFLDGSLMIWGCLTIDRDPRNGIVDFSRET